MRNKQHILLVVATVLFASMTFSSLATCGSWSSAIGVGEPMDDIMIRNPIRNISTLKGDPEGVPSPVYELSYHPRNEMAIFVRSWYRGTQQSDITHNDATLFPSRPLGLDESIHYYFHYNAMFTTLGVSHSKSLGQLKLSAAVAGGFALGWFTVTEYSLDEMYSSHVTDSQSLHDYGRVMLADLRLSYSFVSVSLAYSSAVFADANASITGFMPAVLFEF